MTDCDCAIGLFAQHKMPAELLSQLPPGVVLQTWLQSCHALSQTDQRKRDTTTPQALCCVIFGRPAQHGARHPLLHLFISRCLRSHLGLEHSRNILRKDALRFAKDRKLGLGISGPIFDLGYPLLAAALAFTNCPRLVRTVSSS